MRSTFLDTIWNAAKRHPWLFLTFILALQTVFTLDSRALWFSDEVRYANVLEKVLDGHWLVMYLNGEMYPDKPPVYFWFLSIISLFFGGPKIAVFYVGAALSGLFYILTTNKLAKVVLPEDPEGGDIASNIGSREIGLAAGLILLTNLYFVGLTHYSRMDLLFGVFIVWSQILFYKGTKEDGFDKRVIAAFALAGIACLTKGPIGFAFPASTILVWLTWTGRAKRVLNRDFGYGIIVFVLIVLAWTLGSYISEGQKYIDAIFYDQIYRRTFKAWHHDQPFWHYGATLPLVWLPWTLLLIILPVKRIFTKAFWNELFANRKQGGGKAFLWTLVVTEFILLSCVSIKIVVYMLPMFAPLAVLTADALLRLGKRDEEEETSRLSHVWLAFAIVLAILALGVPIFEFFNQWDLPIRGAGLLVLIVLATAGALMLLRKKPVRRPLLAFVFGITLLIIPLGTQTLPSIDNGMSPKGVALLMGDYMKKGYWPAAFDTYAGIYNYYAGGNYYETKDLDGLLGMVEEHPKAVVAFQKKHWKRAQTNAKLKNKDTLKKMRVIYEQWITDRPYVVVIKD